MSKHKADSNSINNARVLKKEQTKEEKHLWYDFLNTYKPKFIRQHVIGKYIVDFYCASKKIAIEIDGSQHYDDIAKEYDQVRTEFLKREGISVLRFTNLEVNTKFREVCESIINATK